MRELLQKPTLVRPLLCRTFFCDELDDVLFFVEESSHTQKKHVIGWNFKKKTHHSRIYPASSKIPNRKLDFLGYIMDHLPGWPQGWCDSFSSSNGSSQLGLPDWQIAGQHPGELPSSKLTWRLLKYPPFFIGNTSTHSWSIFQPAMLVYQRVHQHLDWKKDETAHKKWSSEIWLNLKHHKWQTCPALCWKKTHEDLQSFKKPWQRMPKNWTPRQLFFGCIQPVEEQGIETLIHER